MGAVSQTAPYRANCALPKFNTEGFHFLLIGP